MAAPVPSRRPRKRIAAAFYRTEAGGEPVREWLKSLPKEERQDIARDVRKVEYGWPIGMPTCDSLGGGLWEVRTNLGDRIARILFGILEGQMVVLHGIIKKSRKAAKVDLDTARTRLRNAEQRLAALNKGKGK